ncbi:hypothetical protein H1R20_g1351, partial [Candolleomyces eurysporus]
MSTHRRGGMKRKKGFTSHEIPEDPGPCGGYVETHTEYQRQQGSVTATTSSINIPPSPIKPTARKKERPPSPPPALEVESVEALAGAPNINLEGPYDVLWVENDSDGEEDRDEGGRKKKRRKTVDSNPLAQFTESVNTMVDELLRLEGPGTLEPACAKGAWWRDTGHVLLTGSRSGPVLASNGAPCVTWGCEFSSDTSTASPAPILAPPSTTIFATQPLAIQLMRARLFPATLTEPRTAASFRVLETFQMLSFTAKTSAYEFLAALKRRTDNTHLEAVPDRYREFMRMVHEWRHLRLLKRTGRGHDPSGMKGTKPGECVVLCPACPLSGINLPEGWNNDDNQWLHALFLAIDANFRLTRRMVSDDLKDPGLNRGYAYIVEETKFKEYLAVFGEQIPDDKSTCNNHDAIKSASIRGGRGFAASGLGTVQCSRHDMKRPNGSGDLQKGERYVNMDYFCLATLEHNIPSVLVISYDIVCQWSVNFVARCLKYPPNPIGSNPAMDIRYLVPKFHLPAHVQKCRDNYSFNLTPHVGRTDGEAPERGWASSNDLAYSTREMGPGSCRDTLDDCFSDMNWNKATRMAATLVSRAEDAVYWRQEQVEAWVSFARTLPADLRRRWTRMARKWEQGKCSTNPFEYDNDVVTISSVRFELALEEETEILAGNVAVVHKEVTPSEFVLQGLNLEDAIRRQLLNEDMLGAHATDRKKSEVLESANTLRRRFISWEELQRLYMPTVMPHRQSFGVEGKASSKNLRDIKLFLPSEVVSVIPCAEQLVRYEFRYWIAQAHATLRDLCERLVVRQHLYSSKKRYSHGTKAVTRSNRKIEAEGKWIAELASRYRSIRQTLVVLSSVVNELSWQDTLKVLEDKDIQGLTTEDHAHRAVGAQGKKDRLGAGRKQLTWIWFVGGPQTLDGTQVDDDGDEAGDEGEDWMSDDGEGSVVGSNDDDNVNDPDEAAVPKDDPALRIEFCSTRARAHRWQEECLLLEQEMDRVERFWRDGR